MAQIFVYEETADPINAAKNGTMNLLRTLPEGTIVTNSDLHNIRREFVQRVFTFYIARHGAGFEDEQS